VQQSRELAEGGAVGFSGGVDKFPKLQMDAYDIRAEPLQLAKIRCQHLPVCSPEILHQAEIVAVIHSPRMKRRTRVPRDEAAVIRADNDLLQR